MVKAYIKINDLVDIIRLNKTSMSCNYDLSLCTDSKIFDPKSLLMLFELKPGRVFPLVAPITKYNEKEKFLQKFGGMVVSYDFY